jgi:predicted glycoside hydrolase/deacetylase ChbG (UPF0249 family)
MARAKRLVVNADELGASSARDAAIFAAHREGILTSASLMVLGATAEEAAREAKQEARLEVGLHLALTDLVPVLSSLEIPSLLDARGRLPAEPAALVAARPEELVQELRAQHGRFRQLVGRPPTHLDVRSHAHSQRGVFEAMVTLGWEIGAPIRGVSAAMRIRLRHEGLSTTDEFVDGFEGGVEGFGRLLERLDAGVTEIRCRPPGAAGPDGDDLGVLVVPEVRQRLSALGVELTGFFGL